LEERTFAREREIQRRTGFRIIRKWECEWKEEKEANPEIKETIKNCDLSKPLNPKDALYGGRTEVFKLIQDNAQMQYIDVCSLYPFVVARKKFPVGHPEIYISNLGFDVEKYFGFIKCQLLPPRKLLHPALPFRKLGKLLFPLCASCPDTVPIDFCRHSDNERILEGTWFSEEVKLAVSKGYEVRKLLQVFHFPVQSSHLFSEFIETFYKLKMLATGLPGNVQSDLEYEEFAKEIFEKENIRLGGKEEFSKNPGIRYIAKILLNSFWGRFALRENRSQFKFVTSIDMLESMLDDESLEIEGLRHIRNNMLGVIYKKRASEFLDISNDRNIYIAAATTSWARIELYKYIDAISNKGINDNVLYCDTDSIIFDSLNDSVKVETGPFLGQMTRELRDNDFITNFCSGGPKNYAFVTNNGDSCIKVKGFSLHFTNRRFFTIGNIREIIIDYISKNVNENGFAKKGSQLKDKRMKEFRNWCLEKFSSSNSSEGHFDKSKGIFVFNPRKIMRDRTWLLHSKREHKIYSFNFDKRMVLPDYSTLPYGYCCD